MSWHSVDHEGHRMWENSNGVRVESSEQIEALERAEHESYQRRLEQCDPYKEAEEDIEPVTKGQAIFLILFLITMAFIAIFGGKFT